jgi:hypothetical protein
MSKSDAIKVTPSIERSFKSPYATTQQLCITDRERANLYDYLRYALESLHDVIRYEEMYGNRTPILNTLREYAREAAVLLERLR